MFDAYNRIGGNDTSVDDNHSTSNESQQSAASIHSSTSNASIRPKRAKYSIRNLHEGNTILNQSDKGKYVNPVNPANPVNPVNQINTTHTSLINQRNIQIQPIMSPSNINANDVVALSSQELDTDNYIIHDTDEILSESEDIELLDPFQELGFEHPFKINTSFSVFSVYKPLNSELIGVCLYLDNESSIYFGEVESIESFQLLKNEYQPDIILTPILPSNDDFLQSLRFNSNDPNEPYSLLLQKRSNFAVHDCRQKLQSIHLESSNGFYDKSISENPSAVMPKHPHSSNLTLSSASSHFRAMKWLSILDFSKTHIISALSALLSYLIQNRSQILAGKVLPSDNNSQDSSDPRVNQSSQPSSSKHHIKNITNYSRYAKHSKDSFHAKNRHKSNTPIDSSDNNSMINTSSLSSLLIIRKMEIFPTSSTLYTDSITQASLSIFKPEYHPGFGHQKEGFSVYGILNQTKTTNGSKLLEYWLQHPTTDIDIITSRLDHIEFSLEYIPDEVLLRLRSSLTRFKDVQRLITKFFTMTVKPADWIAFIETLQSIIDVQATLHAFLGNYQNIYSAQNLYQDGNTSANIAANLNSISSLPSKNGGRGAIQDPFATDFSSPQHFRRGIQKQKHTQSQPQSHPHLHPQPQPLPLLYQHLIHNLDDDITELCVLLQNTINIPQTRRENRIIIQKNIHPGLDALKNRYLVIDTFLQTVLENDIESGVLPLFHPQMHYCYFPQIGYLLSIPKSKQLYTEDSTHYPSHRKSSNIGYHDFSHQDLSLYYSIISLEEQAIVNQGHQSNQIIHRNQPSNSNTPYASRMTTSGAALTTGSSSRPTITSPSSPSPSISLSSSSPPSISMYLTDEILSVLHIDAGTISALQLQYQFQTDEYTFYSTSRTRELDTELGDIQVQIVDIERELAYALAESVIRASNYVETYAQWVVELDVILSLSVVSRDLNLKRPQITDKNGLYIRNSRHLLYSISMDTFITNDVLMYDSNCPESCAVFEKYQKKKTVHFPRHENGNGNGKRDININKTREEDETKDSIDASDANDAGAVASSSINIGNDNNNNNNNNNKSSSGSGDGGGGLIHVVTGPNSSGKTVLLKQIGIIVYLTHIGSFVPAETGTIISICDKLFTRTPNSDSATNVISTYTKDISQMSLVLRNCTPKSLVLVDEFGTGTNSQDGIALFASLCEYLSNGVRDVMQDDAENSENLEDGMKGATLDQIYEAMANINDFENDRNEIRKCKIGTTGIYTQRQNYTPKAILTTHFHEVFTHDLLRESNVLRFKNMSFAFQHENITTNSDNLGKTDKKNTNTTLPNLIDLPRKIIPLFKLQNGWCDNSYGFSCALMAGIPPRVIQRAQHVVEKLEKQQEITQSPYFTTDLQRSNRKITRDNIETESLSLLEVDIRGGDESGADRNNINNEGYHSVENEVDNSLSMSITLQKYAHIINAFIELAPKLQNDNTECYQGIDSFLNLIQSTVGIDESSLHNGGEGGDGGIATDIIDCRGASDSAQVRLQSTHNPYTLTSIEDIVETIELETTETTETTETVITAEMSKIKEENLLDIVNIDDSTDGNIVNSFDVSTTGYITHRKVSEDEYLIERKVGEVREKGSQANDEIYNIHGIHDIQDIQDIQDTTDAMHFHHTFVDSQDHRHDITQMSQENNIDIQTQTEIRSTQSIQQTQLIDAPKPSQSDKNVDKIHTNNNDINQNDITSHYSLTRDKARGSVRGSFTEDTDIMVTNNIANFEDSNNFHKNKDNNHENFGNVLDKEVTRSNSRVAKQNIQKSSEQIKSSENSLDEMLGYFSSEFTQYKQNWDDREEQKEQDGFDKFDEFDEILHFSTAPIQTYSTNSQQPPVSSYIANSNDDDDRKIHKRIRFENNHRDGDVLHHTTTDNDYDKKTDGGNVGAGIKTPYVYYSNNNLTPGRVAPKMFQAQQSSQTLSQLQSQPQSQTEDNIIQPGSLIHYRNISQKLINLNAMHNFNESTTQDSPSKDDSPVSDNEMEVSESKSCSESRLLDEQCIEIAKQDHYMIKSQAIAIIQSQSQSSQISQLDSFDNEV